MNIQDYISSGLIESSVLGLSSQEEMEEFEALKSQFPEFKEAVTAFEMGLESTAIANAIAPPVALKNIILQALSSEVSNKKMNTLSSVTSNNGKAKVVPITAAPKGIKWLRGAVAAAVILLLCSAILNFYFYSQFKKYNEQYTNLLSEQSTLIAKNDAFKASFEMLRDTAMFKVTMQAAAPTVAGSLATVYWQTTTKDVYLLINNLPQHNADMEYQLWAMVDGKPVNAGMVCPDSSTHFCKMENIQKAQAFAITLEKKGGSKTPHMESIYVIGKV